MPDPIAAAALAQLHRRRQTMQYLADVSDVPVWTLSRWFGGKKTFVKLSDVEAVMRVLGLVVVPLEDLDARQGPARPHRPFAPPPRRPHR